MAAVLAAAAYDTAAVPDTKDDCDAAEWETAS